MSLSPAGSMSTPIRVFDVLLDLLVPHGAQETCLGLHFIEACPSSGGGGIHGVALLINKAGESYALGGLF